MMTDTKIDQEIEALRRQLHQGLGSKYDPGRLQALAPISQELDRLTVELVRKELTRSQAAPAR